MIRITIFSILLLLYSCNQNVEDEPQSSTHIMQNPLVGSWELQEIHWHNSDTTFTINPSQPGLLLFSEDRYALMWSPNRTPRVPFQDLSQPTDAEIKAGFQSVVFNGGSYSQTDSTVTTRASIAKVPGFEGGTQYYRYTIKDSLLDITMFDETYPSGEKPAWFGTWTTQFIYRKSR